jgi:hypothetical protein
VTRHILPGLCLFRPLSSQVTQCRRQCAVRDEGGTAARVATLVRRQIGYSFY